MKLIHWIRARKPTLTERPVDPLRSIGRFRLRCNLCGKAFRANSRFLRFCRGCKAEDEVFRFSEWMRG
jgi:hypothetical protein